MKIKNTFALVCALVSLSKIAVAQGLGDIAPAPHLQRYLDKQIAKASPDIFDNPICLPMHTEEALGRFNFDTALTAEGLFSQTATSDSVIPNTLTGDRRVSGTMTLMDELNYVPATAGVKGIQNPGKVFASAPATTAQRTASQTTRPPATTTPKTNPVPPAVKQHPRNYNRGENKSGKRKWFQAWRNRGGLFRNRTGR